MATVPLSHDDERGEEQQRLFLTPAIIEWINEKILPIFGCNDTGSFEVFIRDGQFSTIKPGKSLRFPRHLTERKHAKRTDK